MYYKLSQWLGYSYKVIIQSGLTKDDQIVWNGSDGKAIVSGINIGPCELRCILIFDETDHPYITNWDKVGWPSKPHTNTKLLRNI